MNFINRLLENTLKLMLYSAAIFAVLFVSSCQREVDYNDPYSAADFTDFTFANILDSAKIDLQAKTINASMTSAGDISKLVITFRLTDGAKAYINGVLQESGHTVNNFSDTVRYTVISGNGQKENIWKVYIAHTDSVPHQDFGGQICSDITLTPAIYTVNEDITVCDNIRFEILPGAAFVFAPSAKMVLGKNSKLIAEGTQEEPIIFKSSDESGAEKWQGIILNEAEAEFSHCKFENGGNAGAFITLNNSIAGIQYCNFSNSDKHGLYLDQNSIFRVFESNTITNCGERSEEYFPVYLKDIHIVTGIGNTNTITTSKGIFIENSTSNDNITFSKQTCPYIFKNDVVFDKNGTSIILDAGVVFKISENKVIKIAENNNVKFFAKGTAESPITFKGLSAVSGSWKGLYFGQKLLAGSTLDFCSFEYAGSGDNTGAIACKLTTEQNLTISNCKIINPNSNGIYFFPNSNATLMENLFQNIPPQYSNIYYE